MKLSVSELKGLLSDPKRSSGSSLAQARRHEARLKFHGQIVDDVPYANQAYVKFELWVRSLIPTDRAVKFMSLMSFPSVTQQLTKDIFTKLERVFESKNALFSFKFEDESDLRDWANYRDKLKDNIWWKTKYFDAIKTEVNSVMVIDMPTTPASPPEPYPNIIHTDRILAIEMNGDEIKTFVFVDGTDICAYTDTHYQRFREDYTEIISSEHMLGYCPAKFIWDDRATPKDAVRRVNPISKSLSSLDWLLFFETAKRYLDLYAPFPIYSAYEEDCNFSNGTGKCDGGYLRSLDNDEYIADGNGLMKCPRCSSHNSIGIGAFITIPAPTTKDDPDLRNPIQRLSADKVSLEYCRSEVERLRQEIIDSSIGRDYEVGNDQAKNETQIRSAYDTKETILLKLKSNIEKVHEWAVETICRLRYGSSFIGCNVDYGTEFYLRTLNELYETYTTARKAGASMAELDVISDQIIDAENKNNAEKRKRLRMLKHLEPYRHITITELINGINTLPVDQVDVKVKLNFSSLINRFERENGNVVDFGVLLPFDERVTIITQKLRDYAENKAG